MSTSKVTSGQKLFPIKCNVCRWKGQDRVTDIFSHRNDVLDIQYLSLLRKSINLEIGSTKIIDKQVL